MYAYEGGYLAMTNYNAPPVAPYDPNVENFDPETPELEHLLSLVVENTMYQLNVCVPARVVAVGGNQQVDLQLLPQTRYFNDNSLKDKPVVKGVPVSMPVGAGYSIKLPIATGDLGLALFADRNLDAYLASNGSSTYDPDDTRAHHLADAIFIPGLPTTGSQTSDSTSDLVLTNGSAVLRVESGGKFKLTNGSNELFSLLGQLVNANVSLVQALQSATTLTMLGPEPLDPGTQAQLAQLSSTLNQLVTNFQSLTG